MDRSGFADRRHAPGTVRRKLGLAAALLATLAAPSPAAPADLPPLAPAVSYATPALWRISDADTTIYLFGTFHTLDAHTVWLDARVREAFDRSAELVLETVVPDDPDALRAAGAAANGRDGKPAAFIQSTRAVIRSGRAAGLSVDHGADQVLRRLANACGKPVAGLEGFGEQLAALSRIRAMPARPAPSAASAPPSPDLNALLVAWKSGNSAAFATMLAGFEDKAPEAYRILIADRNSRWADWVAARLDQPGVVFVAVGSGHLAGKDSVQQRLARRGIAAARVG